MSDAHPFTSFPGHMPTVFQMAANEVLAQRVEGLALELRAIGKSDDGALASNETLSVVAVTLRIILKKIDEIFEFDGFVFTPACMILLELFQARARGSVISSSALCQAISCASPVTRRWVDLMESKQLVEILDAKAGDSRVILTEKGYLKTAQALQLLL